MAMHTSGLWRWTRAILLAAAVAMGAGARAAESTTPSLAATPATPVTAVTTAIAPATTATASVATTTTTSATTTAPAWRPGVREASFADDWREGPAGEARVFTELADGNTSGFEPTTPATRGAFGKQPTGSLTGKTVFASAGHGWTWDTTTSLWYTQRPYTHGIVEDMGNIDQVNLFADYCFRAGATVVPMRPLGNQLIERVVDNTSPFARFQGPWHDSTSALHFGEAGDRVPYRYAIASREETAVARFAPYFPKADFYPVYAWARDGADRANQTYRIVHPGAVNEVRVDHRRIGRGWVYLGEYWFDRGRSGFVEITNKVNDPYDADGAHVVVADAVRFGNGMGDVNRGGGISGKPREQEASRYWVERSLGAGVAPIFDTVEGASDQNNNVGTPPRMAAHMNRERDGSFFDRIFLSFHSNAAGTRGVVGLFNNEAEFRPDGQVEWAHVIARQINEDLATTAGVDVGVPWHVNPKPTDSHINFGELRRDYINNEMCATIAEVAFHDQALDGYFLRSPDARRAFARASYKAVLKFLNAQGGLTTFTVAPEPPVMLSVVAQGAGVTVSWAPTAPNPIGGEPPSAYRVARSPNGFGFDGGVVITTGTSVAFDGMTTDVPHFFRVTALNAGGESAPSRVLGICNGATTAPRVMIVSAFSSLGEEQNVIQAEPAGLGSAVAPGGEFARIIPGRMNAGNYTAFVGGGLAAAGYSFDSCTAEGLAAGAARLGGARAALVMFGRQLPRDGVLTAPMREALAAFTAQGGPAIVSGASVLSSLDAVTTGEQDAARRFAHEVLGAGLAADPAGHNDAGTLRVRGAAGAPLSTATLALDDGTGNAYRAAGLDELAATTGSVPLLVYDNPGKTLAGVLRPSAPGRGAVVTFSFPVETVTDDAVRRALLDSLLQSFGLVPAPPEVAEAPARASSPRQPQGARRGGRDRRARNR